MEIRCLIDESGRATVTSLEFVQMFDDAVKEIKADMDSQGRGDEFMGARIIYSTVRILEPEDLEWYLADCIQLKLAFPHVIAGLCFDGA